MCKTCGDRYETASGYTMTCILNEGHEGLCKGYILGSYGRWSKGDISDEHQYWLGVEEQEKLGLL